MCGRRLRRSLVAMKILATIAVAVAAALAGPSIAGAYELSNIAITPEHTLSTGVLDLAGGSGAPGVKVVQNAVNGTPTQHWDVVHVAWNVHRIVNRKSGLCLTTSGVAGQQLYITYCNADNPRQNWDGRPAEIGYSAQEIYNPATYLRIDVQNASGLAGT